MAAPGGGCVYPAGGFGECLANLRTIALERLICLAIGAEGRSECLNVGHPTMGEVVRDSREM